MLTQYKQRKTDWQTYECQFLDLDALAADRETLDRDTLRSGPSSYAAKKSPYSVSSPRSQLFEQSLEKIAEIEHLP